MGSEMYYRDVTGKKQDAEIHAEIMTPKADQTHNETVIHQAIIQGMTEQEARSYYGIPKAKEQAWKGIINEKEKG